MLKLISSLKSNAIAIMGGLIGFLYLALKLSRSKTDKVEAKLKQAKRKEAAETAKSEKSNTIREAVDTQIDENISAEIERHEIPSSIRRSSRLGTSDRLF